MSDVKETAGSWSRLTPVLPGLAVAIGLALLARPVAGVLGGWLLKAQGVDPTRAASPISAITVAVVFGLVAANVVKIPVQLKPGLDLAVKKALRLGIILVGIKLSVLDVARVGLAGVPVVLALVGFALGVGVLTARKLGVGDRLGALAAASTAICGITATLAVAPGIKADDKEVAYTVANVTLLGLFGMLVYPYLAHALFAHQPGSAGLFLGTAIHDTSQVMGAAIGYRELFGDEQAMKIATVAKLTRNSMLVVVVPFLTWWYARSHRTEQDSKPSFWSLFPTFILGFLALAALRSGGDALLASSGSIFGILDATGWKSLITAVGETGATLSLATALAGVGLTTRLDVLKGLGLKPLAVGVTAAMLVALASLALAAWVGPFLA